MRTINLCAGPGDGITSACLMTASNMLMGQGRLGDYNPCVCKVLREFIIPTNDFFSRQHRTEFYGPLVWEILGTRTANPVIIEERQQVFADWLKTKHPRAYDNLFLTKKSIHFAREAAMMVGFNYSRDISDGTLPRQCAELIRKAAAIGDTRPVEAVITHDQLADRLCWK